MRRSFLALAPVLVLTSGAAAPEAAPERLVACGWGNLSIFEFRPGTAEPLRETWFWKPQDYEGVPAEVDDLYRHIDECKPLDGGDRILISASTDGIGLVDRPSRRFIHFGTARNAHSIEPLPRNRIAVANSHGGDDLVVMNARAGAAVLIRKPLPGGHGVHWDAAGQRLYALSNRTIEVYALVDWDSDRPDLRLERTIALPEQEGHDLSRIPGTTRFHLTTATRTWTYDSRDGSIAPHVQLSGEAHVKAVSTHSATGDMAWVKADPGGWWSYNLRFVRQGAALTLPVSKRYYKVRWIDDAAGSWPAS